MQNGHKSKTVYFLLFLLFVPSFLYGQNNRKTFKTISISANYLQNSNRNLFHNYWKPANGIDFQIETEFYLGKAELGVQLSLIKTQKSIYPEYKSAYLYFGWSWDQTISQKIHLYSGFQLGHYFMYFKDNSIDINLRSESEFGVGFKTGLKLNLGSNLFINISGRYQVIYTYHRIHLYYISLGFGKSFDTPKWLRKFLN